MAINKIWHIKGREENYSDLELKKMISNNEVSKDDMVYTDEISEPIKLDDSIYRFYFKNEEKK